MRADWSMNYSRSGEYDPRTSVFPAPNVIIISGASSIGPFAVVKSFSQEIRGVGA